MSHSLVMLAAIAAVCMAIPAAAAEDVPAKLIAMERAALDGSDRGDVTLGLKLTAPDVVYMDPWQERPIIGKADLTAYYRKIFKPEPKAIVAGEMLNARVQMLGNTAVLTYNYIVRKVDTHAVVRRWNALEVYTKRDGEWRIVTTHWSFTEPKLAQE